MTTNVRPFFNSEAISNDFVDYSFIKSNSFCKTSSKVLNTLSYIPFVRVVSASLRFSLGWVQMITGLALLAIHGLAYKFNNESFIQKKISELKANWSDTEFVKILFKGVVMMFSKDLNKITLDVEHAVFIAAEGGLNITRSLVEASLIGIPAAIIYDSFKKRDLFSSDYKTVTRSYFHNPTDIENDFGFLRKYINT